MKEVIEDTQLLFQRIKYAQEAILKAKQLDKANGGRTIKEIWVEMENASRAYYLEKEDVINKAEVLNASPYEIPGNFVSAQQIMAQIGEKEPKEVIVVDDMELTPIDDFNRYLTYNTLCSLTQRWLNLQEKGVDPLLEYYYNDTFCSSLLVFQRRIIETEGVEAVDLYLEAYDRPLIYAYDPKRSSEDVQVLIDEWKNYEDHYKVRMNELDEEEINSSRGDYIVEDLGILYYENGHMVFEVASRMFWDYVQLVYRLSDEHPECFGQGASIVIDKLYEYYKEEISGGWELSRQDFELKAIRQFLYFSNDVRQLRIDLFRQIDVKKERTDEVFTGGLYHVFDHFKGLRVSTESKGDYELHEGRLLEIIRDLFFSHANFVRDRIDKKGHHWGQEYIAESVFDTPIKFDGEEWQSSEMIWKGVFVLDLAKNLFYLNALYIIGSNKE